ncbi:Rz1-like lysis system protein LysC [Aggregatibacter actinomycetemcomitans]|uniref:Rz1-like lysis system protein LysC n=1 Tax=Aggregatibacter actinomycetemcomitans TaxID=714 RepID=UPI001F11CDB6|nr:Rz1-like lysis system protein LysC [Aggregatibacter actinomycetemcomitans]
MILSACSTAPQAPTKQPILCPASNKCGKVPLHIETNRDLVIGLQNNVAMVGVCVLEINALKQCINDFNQTTEPKK